MHLLLAGAFYLIYIIMQSIIYIVSLLLILLQQQDEPLAIKRFEPARAAVGDSISIHGTGFSTRSDMPNVVIFNGGINVPYKSTSNCLKVVVPQGANTGRVTVRWGYQKTISPSELIITKKTKKP